MDFTFRVAGDAWKKPDHGFVPDDQTDFVERSGYRSTEVMVREMVMAGERLADWRAAQYPMDAEFLDATPVFGDRLTLEDRFRALQLRRERQRVSQAAVEVPAVVESVVPPKADVSV